MKRETIYIGVCPSCYSLNVVPILRGYPSQETREKIKNGKAVWAGCDLVEEAPNWLCRDCEHAWHQR
jgi:hypothetical protein